MQLRGRCNTQRALLAHPVRCGQARRLQDPSPHLIEDRDASRHITRERHSLWLRPSVSSSIVSNFHHRLKVVNCLTPGCRPEVNNHPLFPPV